jgi:hypothetical protein
MALSAWLNRTPSSGFVYRAGIGLEFKLGSTRIPAVNYFRVEVKPSNPANGVGFGIVKVFQCQDK